MMLSHHKTYVIKAKRITNKFNLCVKTCNN